VLQWCEDQWPCSQGKIWDDRYIGYQNMIQHGVSDEVRRIMFWYEEDAVLFKLRWHDRMVRIME